jgi:hypothetical protein
MPGVNDVAPPEAKLKSPWFTPETLSTLAVRDFSIFRPIARSTSGAANRKRRYRRRQRLGRAVLAIEISSAPLIEVLIESGHLTEAESLDRRKVEAATGKVVDAWTRYWREHGT